MTALRQRLLEDLQLRGYSAGTQQLYVRAVRQLAEYAGKAPDQITEEELRQYFLYLTQEKRLSQSSCTVALCGIKFFYAYTLQRRWPTPSASSPPNAPTGRLRTASIGCSISPFAKMNAACAKHMVPRIWPSSAISRSMPSNRKLPASWAPTTNGSKRPGVIPICLRFWPPCSFKTRVPKGNCRAIQKSVKEEGKGGKSSRLGRIGGDETDQNDQEQEPR
jgi:hypothetical protein